jgi:hypothetical protein
MNAKKTTKTAWGLLGLLAMTATALTATAANPARVNISVTITAAKSVSVDGVASSTRAHTWNGTPNQMFDNTASSITVLNDSGILSETWGLSTLANSINTAGNAPTWSRVGSTATVAADEFAVQAVFGSSNTLAGGCASVTATTWNNATIAPALTASAVTYTNTVFASSELTNAGGSQAPDLAGGTMYAGNKRALCYRAVMPNSSATTDGQNVQVVVTAQ